MTEGAAEELGSANPIMRTGPTTGRGPPSLGLAYHLTEEARWGLPKAFAGCWKRPRGCESC